MPVLPDNPTRSPVLGAVVNPVGPDRLMETTGRGGWAPLSLVEVTT